MQSARTFSKFHVVRPAAKPLLWPAPARAQLESWVDRYGINSTSYVLLEGVKQYFTSPRVDGFLAYQIRAGVAVIGGDPVCPRGQAVELFSSLKSPLTIEKLASDYADTARALRPYATVDPGTPVFVYGWSLGAGFAIGVGSDPTTRGNWAGVISIGLPKQNQLVSGVAATMRI